MPNPQKCSISDDLFSGFEYWVLLNIYTTHSTRGSTLVLSLFSIYDDIHISLLIHYQIL